MPLHTSNISGQRRWLFTSIALLLVVAQLISQLHSLEHLDEHDDDTHSELSCIQCILTADLKSNATPGDVVLGTGFKTSVVIAQDSYPLYISTFTNIFEARAPPVVPHLS